MTYAGSGASDPLLLLCEPSAESILATHAEAGCLALYCCWCERCELFGVGGTAAIGKSEGSGWLDHRTRRAVA